MSARTRIALASVVAALSLVVPAAPASATGTLDQQFVPISPASVFSVGGSFWRAQSFKAGATGLLDQVDLALFKPGPPASVTVPLTVEIRTLSGGLPSQDPPLASASVLAVDVPAGFSSVSVPLTPPAPSVTGTQYAIVLSAPDGLLGHYGWLGKIDALLPYADGNEFFSVDGGASWSSDSPLDAGLRTDVGFKTYVAPWNFAGFFSPVNNAEVNLAKAGSSIPVKFSLGGDQGLEVLAAGYPKLVFTQCDPDDVVDPVEETSTANKGLTYDALTDTYTYVWKTDKSWKGKCGTFTLKLDDGSEHTADFQLK